MRESILGLGGCYFAPSPDMNGGIYNRSTLNRFVTADTIIPEPGDSQAYNRYAYVLNNPIGLVDPSGHAPCISAHDEGTSCPVAEIPPYVYLYQFLLEGPDGTLIAAQGTMTFIDGNAALLSNHAIPEAYQDYKLLGIEFVSAACENCSPSDGTFISASDFAFIDANSRMLGDMRGMLSLLVFANEVISDVDAASIGSFPAHDPSNDGRAALQAATRNVQNGLYETQIISSANPVDGEPYFIPYWPLQVSPDLTVAGDSGAPIIVDGTVRGVNNSSLPGVSRASYGRITSVTYLRNLIGNITNLLRD